MLHCLFSMVASIKDMLQMRSMHKIEYGTATAMQDVGDESIDLVVTSPPYPMIEMWDGIFSQQCGEVKDAIANGDGNRAFEFMHGLLDRAWREVYRVLKPGGFACINIGDATRTIKDHFRLYSNHARILNQCLGIGFSNLPAIIWRKQTNAPNKFMGSGMLPAGAYVTLEHEFVLVLRKGEMRKCSTPAEKLHRLESAFFWEERNVWFSDVWWDLKGTGQALNNREARQRSGAFPFELPYRLINMYSMKGDTVLDPFLGTGTTTLAALATARNSIGVEIDDKLSGAINDLLTHGVVERSNELIRQRLSDHIAFVAERERTHGSECFKHRNRNYDFPVMTKQEVEIKIEYLKGVNRTHGDTIVAEYEDNACLDYAEMHSLFAPVGVSTK
jgi:DNA modification methylase